MSLVIRHATHDPYERVMRLVSWAHEYFALMKQSNQIWAFCQKRPRNVHMYIKTYIHTPPLQTKINTYTLTSTHTRTHTHTHTHTHIQRLGQREI